MAQLILTPEQKGLRLLNLRHSEEGQLGLTFRAIGRAIAATNQELVLEGGRPSFTAVLGALGDALADHLAAIDDDAQRAQMVAAVSAELAERVVAYRLQHETAGRG